ncbi:hypothetical protein GW932_01865 [archaeon]|nr:hypothetical protein [archaeon]
MSILNPENLSFESYNSILEMIDEMERSGLVKLAREKAARWIKEYEDCKYYPNFYYKPIK